MLEREERGGANEYVPAAEMESLDESSGTDQAMLIAQAKQGCAESRQLVLDGCRDYLRWIAHEELDGRLSPKCDASDLVQNTFVKAVQHFDDFRGTTKSTLLGWLRAILCNEIAMLRRSLYTAEKRDVSREAHSSRDSSVQTPSQIADRNVTPNRQSMAHERPLLLLTAMNKLSPDHRKVILLRNWERLSFAQVAAQMERSEAAVKKLWARALLQLKSELINVQSESSWKN